MVDDSGAPARPVQGYLTLKCPGLCSQIGLQRNIRAKTARDVGVQLVLVLGHLIDTIRQQCAKFDRKRTPLGPYSRPMPRVLGGS